MLTWHTLYICLGSLCIYIVTFTLKDSDIFSASKIQFCPFWEHYHPSLRMPEHNKGPGRGIAKKVWKQLSRLRFRIQGHREQELLRRGEVAFHPQQRDLGE